MEFKVGDRVRYVVQRDIDNVKVGEVGIIRGISPYGDYAVDFEESGFKHSCDGLCQSNHGWWCSGDTLEPVDSKIVRMADGTIIGDFSTGGFCDDFRGGKIPTPSKPVSIEEQIGLPKGISIHDLPTNELIVPWNMIPNFHIETDMSVAELCQKLSEHFNTLLKQRTCGKRAENIYFDENIFKEEKVMKFTFNTTEGYRIDKSNNTKIPTITTEVIYKDKDGCAKGGSATCDKTDYNERQGVIEALANMCCDGNFDREYNKAVKWNKKQDLRNRTCRYCGQVFDTYLERIKHMDWHVECRKERHERYRLRKRAKEIAFEEAAQKMAKEIAKENK